MSCKTKGQNETLSLHEVESVTMCDIHFCALKRDNHTVSCSGFVLGFGNYDKTHIMNPLTPDVDMTGFTAENKPMSNTIGKSFQGYNVQTLYYEADVVTEYDDEVDFVECADPYTTCVSSGDDVQCFGGKDVTFLSGGVSFAGGLVTAMPVALVVLFAARIFLNGDRAGAGLCAAPAVAFLVALISVTNTAHVAIKSVAYMEGALTGYMLAMLILYFVTQWCVMLRRDVRSVQQEEASGGDTEDFEKELDKDLEDVESLNISAPTRKLLASEDEDKVEEIELTKLK